MDPILIARGAEAELYRTEKGIEKRREQKRYRHPALDKGLRITRTRAEDRILAKARAAGVKVPGVRVVSESVLLLEEIHAAPLKETLDAKPALAHALGEMMALLHDAHIIHGDLTTSNVLCDAQDVLTLIDFGLSYHSQRIEDKAVDLHLCRQALESKHPRVSRQAYRHLLAGYRNSAHAAEVLERLQRVTSRGRNKGGS